MSIPVIVSPEPRMSLAASVCDSREPAEPDNGPSALNFPPPNTGTGQNRTRARCYAGKESERQCLHESCKGEVARGNVREGQGEGVLSEAIYLG